MIMAVKKDMTQNADEEEQNPTHDEGYKGILSHNEVFLHFLRKYFASAAWTANISDDELERIDKSFITKEYRKMDSDVIYKLKINNTDVYFYVLLELQSRVDFTMPFRLLRYMVELLNYIFKNTDEKVRERKDFRLPAVVPIVLYNGKWNWTAAKTYREYTKDYGAFGSNIIDFRYLLFDLNRTDEEIIEPVENPLDAVFVVEKLRIRKKLTSDNFAEWWWAKDVAGLPKNDRDMLIDWMEQIYYGGNMPPDLKKMLQHNIKKGDIVKMKSLVEVWKADARRVGVLEGMSEGEKRKALEIARTMRAEGMDVDTVARLTGLTVDDILRL